MFTDLISNIRFADLLDIGIISIFTYLCLIWLRQKISRTVIIGIASITILYIMAHRLDMYLTSLLFKAGFTAIIMTLVLIFQEDIRRAFEQFTTTGIFPRKRLRSALPQTVDVLVDAMSELAKNRIGALVVIKGRESLERNIRGGFPLHGSISLPLLYSIFSPESPGHDGAVIVDGEQIESFGVHLPLSSNLGEVGAHGTRHTAGLGLAERSDALVIIVSEEYGTISIAMGGRLISLEPGADLKKQIEQFYMRIAPPSQRTRRHSWFTRHLGRKLIAVLTASFLWAFFAYRIETIHRTYSVPIEYRNLLPMWEIEDLRPIETRISLSGTEHAFAFDVSQLIFSLDLSKIHEGTQEVVLSDHDLSKPKGLTVTQISPKTVKLKAHQNVELDLPVRVPFEGKLPDNLQLAAIQTEPQTIHVQIPVAKRAQIKEIRTESVYLDELTKSTALRMHLIVPNQVHILDEERTYVRVVISLEKKKR